MRFSLDRFSVLYGRAVQVYFSGFYLIPSSLSMCQEIVMNFRSRKLSGVYRVNSPRLYVPVKSPVRVSENLSSQYTRGSCTSAYYLATTTCF